MKNSNECVLLSFILSSAILFIPKTGVPFYPMQMMLMMMKWCLNVSLTMFLNPDINNDMSRSYIQNVISEMNDN